MADEDLFEDVPEGTAVFPLIPTELGMDPLLLAVLHAVVFLIGSSEDVVHPDAAEEALQYLSGYLQRLEGTRLRKVQEDIKVLLDFARQEKWPKADITFLKSFLTEMGIKEQ